MIKNISDKIKEKIYDDFLSLSYDEKPEKTLNLTKKILQLMKEYKTKNSEFYNHWRINEILLEICWNVVRRGGEISNYYMDIWQNNYSNCITGNKSSYDAKGRYIAYKYLNYRGYYKSAEKMLLEAIDIHANMNRTKSGYHSLENFETDNNISSELRTIGLYYSILYEYYNIGISSHLEQVEKDKKKAYACLLLCISCRGTEPDNMERKVDLEKSLSFGFNIFRSSNNPMINSGQKKAVEMLSKTNSFRIIHYNLAKLLITKPINQSLALELAKLSDNHLYPKAQKLLSKIINDY